MKKIGFLVSSLLLALFFFVFNTNNVSAQCLPEGSCIGPSDICCSKNYVFDLSCPVTETRCGASAGGTCECTKGLPVCFGCQSCVVDLTADNCGPDFVAVCAEVTVDCKVSNSRPCRCEPADDVNCGEENELCCPGDTCFDPLVCTTIGPGATRCLRPCDSPSDCNSDEVCLNGGCVHNIAIPPPAPGEELCTDGTSINSAIGCIPVESSQEFLEFLLSWAMGIAGGIALILIVYAGFLIITSAGDPKKLQAGKELLTAAVMGLALIIFAAFVLQFIGVEILNIPGFGT